MQAAEQRLTERLASFFAATAQDVSRQISAHLGHDDASKVGASSHAATNESKFSEKIRNYQSSLGYAGSESHTRSTLADIRSGTDSSYSNISNAPAICATRRTEAGVSGLDFPVVAAITSKSSDHGGADLHVKPENAIPIDLPSVDVVTQANVQHVSWELVREGQTQTTRRKIAIADLIATQKVVDRERLAKHMEQLRETGELDEKWPPLVLRWDGDFFLLSGHHGTVAAKELGWTEIPADVMSSD
jgi:hypothetical protein